MKSVFCALLLTAAALTSGQASACTDVYLTRFAFKPAEASVWVVPDDQDARLQLPLKWVASNSNFKLTLDGKRLSASQVEIVFALEEKSITRVLKAVVLLSTDAPKRVATTIRDPATGDEWSVQLLPVCFNL